MKIIVNVNYCKDPLDFNFNQEYYLISCKNFNQGYTILCKSFILDVDDYDIIKSVIILN